MSAGYGFECGVPEFLYTEVASIVGHLSSREAYRLSGAVESKQIRVWNQTIEWLKTALVACLDSSDDARRWNVCLEYEIPRRGSRIDAVILASDLIILIEFKSGKADSDSQRQVEDYGLELIDFHEDSHDRLVIPIVCAGSTQNLKLITVPIGTSKVQKVSITCPSMLSSAISELYIAYHDPNKPDIDKDHWLNSPYKPTPTIIEAARALYAGHKVEDISQSQASSIHMERTENAVTSVVERAGKECEKAICFITGVPGAGKTLAGLNIVHRLGNRAQTTFLSGNGPLVKVLQAALTIDFMKRQGMKKNEATHRATTSITNVHKWLDEYIDRSPNRVPYENIVVFDEAQRAWNRAHSKRKFDRDSSEPEMILRAMDRHEDWSVLIALIGGGQEINTGEAGLSEWGRTLNDMFPHWKIAISPELLTGHSSTAGSVLFGEITSSIEQRLSLIQDLHLAVSQRSYRGVRLTEWVEKTLMGQAEEAASLLSCIPDYPVVLTRDLEKAKEWLREKARGLRQCGFVASSGARRLRVHGFDVSAPIDAADWFLKPHDDVRSSNYLEIPATEFGIQGLELDWIGLAWGGDLRRCKTGWQYMQFRGTRWQSVNKEEKRQYMINKYRVLLTRAREGLVIWVSPGDEEDSTRTPSIYNSTYEYLLSCGIPLLD